MSKPSKHPATFLTITKSSMSTKPFLYEYLAMNSVWNTRNFSSISLSS